MFRSFGALELGVIFAIVVVLFGSGRISKIGKEFGEAIGLFKKGLNDVEKEDTNEENSEE